MTVSTETFAVGASGGWQPAFGSEINSLADGNAVKSSIVLSNAALDMFLDVSFLFASITTVGSPHLVLYLYPLLQDGTLYGDSRFGSAAAGFPPSNYYCGFAGLPVGTQVCTGEFQLPGRRSPIILPIGNSKLVLLNKLGVTTAGSGNAIQYRTYTRKVTS